MFKADSTVLDTITSGVDNGGTFSYTYTPSTPIDNTITLSVDVKDGTQTVTKSIKITFCYPTYYGIVADTVTSMGASDIQTLTNRVAVIILPPFVFQLNQVLQLVAVELVDTLVEHLIELADIIQL